MKRFILCAAVLAADAFDTLTIPEIRCTSGEENCSADVEFVDGDDLRFSQSG